MPPTSDELTSFLKAAHEHAEGRLLAIVDMWALGEALGWDRAKTGEVCERLIGKGLIVGMGPSGIALTVDGVDLCEESLEPAPPGRELRLQLLRLIYEEAGGSTKPLVNAFAVGQDAGLDEAEVNEIVFYLQKRCYLHGVSPSELNLTPQGLALVETTLSDPPTVEERMA